MNDRWQGLEPEEAWAPFQPDELHPWNALRVRHLYRRACFSALPAQVPMGVGKAPEKLVDEIVDASLADNDEEQQFEFLSRSIKASGDTNALGSWWTYRLVFTQRPLREKLAIFWHSHFATSAEKVDDVDLMLSQNQILRRHALGSFRAMTHAIAQDPAMLIYLDSVTNRKAHPNENFARELMELFCLGEGNYSERDVQELSRCFTGWEIRRDKYRFNRYQHDDGIKEILGRSDTFPEASAVDWVLDQPTCAQFLARKLFRYFVWDEPQPSDAMLEPLAAVLRNHGLNIEPAIRTLLKSRVFYSPAAIGHQIRSPVDFVMGVMRPLQATGNAELIAKGMAEMGQSLFFPPNVKGWDGGRTWINASSLLSRANFVTRLLDDDKTRFGRRSLSELLDERGFQTPEQVLEHLIEQLLVVGLDESAVQTLLSAAQQKNGMENQSRELLRSVTLLPQYQLA